MDGKYVAYGLTPHKEITQLMILFVLFSATGSLKSSRFCSFKLSFMGISSFSMALSKA